MYQPFGFKGLIYLMGKTTDDHCIGGWGGPRAGLNVLENKTGLFYPLEA